MLVAVAELSPAAFGSFSVAWVTTVIANTLIYTGSYEYLLRVHDIDDVKHSAFGVLFCQGLLGTTLLFAGGLIAGASGNDASRVSFFAMMPVPILTACCCWCDALLTRRGHTATVGALLFVAELLGACSMVVTLRLGWGYAALLVWRLSATTLSFLLLALFTDGAPRFAWSRAAMVSTLKAALPLQGTSLLSLLATYAADLMLAWRFSPAASASYRAAARVAVTGADVFTQPLRSMTWAAMGEREREGDREGMGKLYLDQLRMLSFFAWPTLVCLSVFSARMFAAISKADWSESGPLLSVLAIGRMANLMQFFVGPVLVCTGRSTTYVRLQTVVTAITLTALGISTLFGALPVAVCDMVLQIGFAVFATSLIRSSIELRWLDIISALAPACLVSLACASLGEIAFRAVELVQPLRLGVSIAVMGLGLLGSFAILRGRLAIRLPGS
jgi:O-antigen/teichoic acid export membrane protein